MGLLTKVGHPKPLSPFVSAMPPLGTIINSFLIQLGILQKEAKSKSLASFVRDRLEPDLWVGKHKSLLKLDPLRPVMANPG
jgi:hypothetical protein